MLSGTGVVTVNGELKVGGVQETITVTGETPVVDVASTKRELTLDNETMRNLPAVRSYSYLLNTVPGLTSNITDVNTGPVFAIFPVHGGRGVESRLTVEGMNISNPPGGNQPPNYTADIGNAQEVSITTSGGLGESETGGIQMNIVPKQGGNTHLGPGGDVRLLEGDAVEQLHRRVEGEGRRDAEPDLPRLRLQRGGGRPDRQGQALVLHERASAGLAPQHPERLLQPERGRRDEVLLQPGLHQAGVLRSQVGELHAAHHVAGVAEEQVHVLVGRAAGVPHVHGHGEFQRLAGGDDVAGCRRPRRVQPAARADGALDEPADQQAAARSGPRQHLLPVGSPRARSESRPRTWFASPTTRRSSIRTARSAR